MLCIGAIEMNGEFDFEIDECDNIIVKTFKESRTPMWFRRPLNWGIYNG